MSKLLTALFVSAFALVAAPSFAASHAGAMPAKHMPLGLEEKHFQAWLGLWQRHCRAHLPAGEAEEMIGLAENIGQRLRWMIAQNGSKPQG